MSPPAKALLSLIQLYKWTLSPLIGRDCRYLPTCSSYAADAVRAHGAWAGSWMAVARLCRCHPLGGSGWDPAPKVTAGRWWKPWTYGDWRGGVRPAEEMCAHDAHSSTGVDLVSSASPLQNSVRGTQNAQPKIS